MLVTAERRGPIRPSEERRELQVGVQQTGMPDSIKRESKALLPMQ
jgi:hypothetical protein